MTLTILWEALGWTALHYLWSGALLGLIAWIGRGLLAGARPELRHAYLCLCMLALAILPVVLLRRNLLELGAGVAPTASVDALAPNASTPWAEVGPAAGAPSAPLWLRLLPLLWALGSLLLVLRLLRDMRGCLRLRRGLRGLEASSRELHAVAARAARSLGLRSRFALRQSAEVSTPLLLGILRPIVVLPSALVNGASPQQIELVLLHELAHLARRDNLVELCCRVLEALLFFQPAVLLVTRWLRVEREHCCDARVLRARPRPREYAELLLALAGERSEPSLAAGAARHPLTQRVERILFGKERSRMHPISILGLGALASLTLAAAPGLAFGRAPLSPELNAAAAHDPPCDHARRRGRAHCRGCRQERELAELLRDQHFGSSACTDCHVDPHTRSAAPQRALPWAPSPPEGARLPRVSQPTPSPSHGHALSLPPESCADCHTASSAEAPAASDVLWRGLPLAPPAAPTPPVAVRELPDPEQGAQALELLRAAHPGIDLQTTDCSNCHRLPERPAGAALPLRLAPPAEARAIEPAWRLPLAAPPELPEFGEPVWPEHAEPIELRWEPPVIELIEPLEPPSAIELSVPLHLPPTIEPATLRVPLELQLPPILRLPSEPGQALVLPAALEALQPPSIPLLPRALGLSGEALELDLRALERRLPPAADLHLPVLRLPPPAAPPAPAARRGSV